MKTKLFFCLKFARPKARAAFTLMETVIAIGVLAVLLTGFIAVFTPAAQGIRRSINSQQADRLTSTLERELVTLRKDTNNLENSGDATTGFEKAFKWLLEGNGPDTAIFVYQYRGDSSKPLRDDGTPEPLVGITGQPGIDYSMQSIARRANEDYLEADLAAVEGSVFYVKPTQLVYENNSMILGIPGTIQHLVGDELAEAADAATYNEAVLAFSAEFYSLPTKSYRYLLKPGKLPTEAFTTRFNSASKPVFTRNLAVRR